MSGFSAAWLALREPADRAARDAGLLARAAAWLAGRPDPRVVDLGAGTGSTFRALADHLGSRQRWLFVDGDADLAAAGRAELAAWAAQRGLSVVAREQGLELTAPGRRITVDWRLADLSRDPLPVEGPVDLVTASALFDLVSAGFVERLAGAVAARGASVHAALDVDGADAWNPPHPADAAVAAGFRADQGRDKGFGAALGPGATRALAAALAGRGYAVAIAASPWRLGPADGPLIAVLADGWATAAAAGGADPAAAAAWRAARLARGGVTACTIGHCDLWASPPA